MLISCATRVIITLYGMPSLALSVITLQAVLMIVLHGFGQWTEYNLFG
jgi:NADH:ubiquinone oxidoreductase subunit F (NADH-binding)